MDQILNGVKHVDINKMIDKVSQFCGNAGFGNMFREIINYSAEEIKGMLKNFELEGGDDAAKLLNLQARIDNFIPILQNLGVKDNKDANNILEEIRKIFGNIKKEDLEADNSPAGIKKVLASSILFSGDNSDDYKVNIDKKDKNIKKEDKLIFLFHGMGDDSGKFYGAIQDTIKDFSVVSVEYNKSSLSNLCDFIDRLYETYKCTIEKFHNIYILGYSFGCLIANKFRSKLLKKFQEEEFQGQDRKVHFIFYKGFYDILKCPLYIGVVSMLKSFNQLYEKAYDTGRGFAFLKDEDSDNELVDVTSNYKLLSESRPVTMFGIENVLTGHTYFGVENSEITNALNKIEVNIKNNPNMNHVLFVSSKNDEMVSEGGMMLYDALVYTQGSAVQKVAEQQKSPDCCY